MLTKMYTENKRMVELDEDLNDPMSLKSTAWKLNYFFKVEIYKRRYTVAFRQFSEQNLFRCTQLSKEPLRSQIL